MRAETGIDELLAWRALCEERTEPSVGTELDERLSDLLRAPAVAATFRHAAEGPVGREGETFRRGFRLVVEAYLDRCCRDQDREIASMLGAWGHEPATLLLGSIWAADGEERQRMLDLWSKIEDRLEPLRRGRREARSIAARDAGAEDLVDFQGARHPFPPAASVEEYERGAIEPLDERIAARARERRAHFVPPLLGPPSAAEAPALSALADHRSAVPGGAARRVLVGLGRELGLDPDAGRGPAIEAASSPSPWNRVLELRLVPRVVVGTLDTPSGLAEAVGTFGRAARAWCVRRSHGPEAAVASDPAFAHGATLLFRRLVLSARFREWAGLSLAEPAVADLGFEEALRPRIAWGLLRLATDRAAGDTARVRGVLSRAAGRPPGIDLVTGTWESDLEGAAILRGCAYAALLEERLQLRLGRGWFRDPRSLRVLRGFWEAECEETVESLARAWDLGTIEPQAVADAYRP